MTPDAIADVVLMTVDQLVAPIVARIGALEKTADHVPAIRERVAALETRAPIPGPPGADGAPGKDGADGFGFDDLSVDFDGDRTMCLKFTRGEIVKTFPIALPFIRYQGVYQNGYAYVIGDVVTQGGAAWHCQKPTTLRPGDGVSAWRLMVKSGRDGKDAGR